MDSIRVGFIGTGRISDLHALEYLRNPHTQIVALCDSDPGLASDRAAAWGLDRPVICSDYHELLALDEVDLVEILLPHHLHAEAALAAFAAGKAVFLQKPIALSLADADRVIDAAGQAGVPFRVYENFIFYPPVMTAKDLVDQGAIGEPLTIRLKSNVGRSETAWPIPKGAQEWRQDPRRSGGGPLLFDDGQHKFALAWHFMGQAEEVHAWIGSTTAPDGYVFDAPAMVSFLFPGGRCGNLEVVYSPELEIDARLLRPGRPGGDHGHPRGGLDQPRARAVGRGRPGAALPRRRDHRLPLDGDRLGDQLRARNAPRHRGAPPRRAAAPVRPRRPRNPALRARRAGVRPHRRCRPRVAGHDRIRA